MYRTLFKLVKRKIPKISDTELIALRSGNTSIDRDILSGTIENLVVTNETVTNLLVSSGTITDMVSDGTVTFNTIIGSDASIGNLSVSNETVSNLVTVIASIGSLLGTSGTFTNL